jgi:uncharacterized SAM-binding protein YcdF (DUF218 family)
MLADGILGWDSYLRAQYTVRTYREGGFHKILLSGGGSPVPVSTAMREYLESQGISKEAILVETASRSTRENALASRHMLEGLPGRKVLLTSDYHMFRAIRAFRRAGIAIEPHSLPDVIKRSQGMEYRWSALIDLGKETAKIVYYFLDLSHNPTQRRRAAEPQRRARQFKRHLVC